jgi:hypothetical protein
VVPSTTPASVPSVSVGAPAGIRGGFGGLQLGQSEIQDLQAVARKEQVLRLDVAVDDALGVGGGQSVRHLNGIIDRFPGWKRTTAKSLAQSLPFEQLLHHVHQAVLRANIEDGNNIRVVQCACGTGLQLKTAPPIRIEPDRAMQHLYSDVAVKTRVASAIKLAHAAGAQRRDDLVRAQASPVRKGHRS